MSERKHILICGEVGVGFGRFLRVWRGYGRLPLRPALARRPWPLPIPLPDKEITQ